MKLTMPIKKPTRSRKSPVALRKPAKKMELRAPARRAAEEDFDDYEDGEPTMRLSQAFIVVLLLHVIAVGGVLLFNYMKTRNEAAAKASKVVASATTSQSSTTIPSSGETTVPAKALPQEVAKETPKEPVKLSRPADGIYVVQAGDTLTQISTKFGISIAAIEAENGLASQSHIKINQRLRIPENEKVVTEKKATSGIDKVAKEDEKSIVHKENALGNTKASATAPVQKSVGEESTYVVEKGDNPYNIAKRFKINYEELLKINQITDPTKLQIGQKLRIPASQGGTN